MQVITDISEMVGGIVCFIFIWYFVIGGGITFALNLFRKEDTED